MSQQGVFESKPRQDSHSKHEEYNESPHRPQWLPHNEGAYTLKQPGSQPRLTVGYYLFSFLSCCHSLAPLAGIILVVPHPRVQHSVCEIYQ